MMQITVMIRNFGLIFWTAKHYFTQTSSTSSDSEETIQMVIEAVATSSVLVTELLSVAVPALSILTCTKNSKTHLLMENTTAD
jgi:hypothetical protein